MPVRGILSDEMWMARRTMRHLLARTTSPDDAVALGYVHSTMGGRRRLRVGDVVLSDGYQPEDPFEWFIVGLVGCPGNPYSPRFVWLQEAGLEGWYRGWAHEVIELE